MTVSALPKQEIVTTPEASDWAAVRRTPRTKDVELRSRTVKWLATLPAELRPMCTARLYPRIVNKIGDLWGHCEYTRLHFQSLLIDRRESRSGFPPDVRQELVALQEYYFMNFSGLPAIIWNAVPIRPRRIPDEIFPVFREETEIEIPPRRA